MVIGCGGSGTLVVKGLKQRLGEQGGAEWGNLFQLLAVDTEPVTLAHRQHLEGREFMNLAQMTIRGDDIIEDMMNPDTEQIYEHLRSWWPAQEDGQRPYRPGAITHGAKATRCVGRLALWHRGEELYRTIEHKFDQALQIRPLSQKQVAAAGDSVKVFIACSLAGGTGSGMFLDIAYMVRDIMRRKGMIAFITGLLIVDTEPFEEVITEKPLVERMQANGYAALCELDWFMGGHGCSKEKDVAEAGDGQSSNRPDTGEAGDYIYNWHYLGDLQIQSREKPFDVCYLCTTTNEHNRKVSRIENLTEIMAEEIFMEIATPLGRTGNSVLDNVERLSALSERRARPLAYSGFAVSSLTLDPEEVDYQCTLNLIQRLLEQLTEPGDRYADGWPNEVKELLPDLPLKADKVVENLAQSLTDDPRSKLRPFEFAAGSQGRSYLLQLSKFRQTLEENFNDFIKPAHQQVGIGLARQYAQKMDQVMLVPLTSNRPSLATLVALAKKLAAEMKEDSWRKAGQQTVAQARQTFDTNLARLRQELARPARRLLFFPTARPERVARAAQESLNSLRQLGEQMLAQQRWETTAAMLEQLIEWPDWYRDQARLFNERLTLTKRHIGDDLDAIRSGHSQSSDHYQLHFEALDNEALERLTDQLQEHVQSDLVGQAIVDELGALGEQTDELAGDRIARQLRRIVCDWLGSKDLGDILCEIHQGDEARVEQQLKRMVQYTAPLWRLHLNHCPEARNWSIIWLVGYAGATADANDYLKQRLKQVLNGYNPIDIRDPSRLILLNTKHGLPLFALSVTRGPMRRAYYKYLNEWLKGAPSHRPVHLSGDWMNLPDFNPWLKAK
jgi:hypothetical protein